MPAPETDLYGLQTYEEMHLDIDRTLYGITDDPSVPYPWNKPREITPIHTEDNKPAINPHELIPQPVL